MYNEQLEQLIEAALKDGMMSGKERQVLFNEAQSLGINLLEFENELNRRILSRKNESVSDSPNNNNNNPIFTKVEQLKQNEESKGTREQEKEVEETKDETEEFEENEEEIKERDEEDKEDPEDKEDTEDYDEDEDDNDSLVRDIVNDFKDTVSDIKSDVSDILHDIIGNPKHTIKSSASQKRPQKNISKNNKTPLRSNSSNRSNFAQLLNSGNLSSKKLNDILDDIVDDEYMTSADCEDMLDFRELKAQKKRVKEALVQFPTPSDKDDLLDFMLYLKPKIQHSEHSDAFLMKYNECVEKVEMLYPEDPDFEKIIGSKVKKNGWGKFRGNMRKTGMVMGGIGRAVWILLKIVLVIIVIIVILAIIGSL